MSTQDQAARFWDERYHWRAESSATPSPSRRPPRIEAHRSDIAPAELVCAWQTWAPAAPDELTVNLALVSEPGAPVQATHFGAATLGAGPTRESLPEFVDPELRADLPYHHLKESFADPRDAPERAVRMRSEFFSHAMTDGTLASLLTEFGAPRTTGRRQLTFTVMGGAYNRVAEDATAFAHRGARFLLEHVADAADPWLDRSWATAHADGSGRVYPNFPDLALDDWAAAYHAGNLPRLRAVKHAYDPHRLFDFHQAI